MALEILRVPDRAEDVRGSAPTPGSLFPDPELVQRGSPATSEPWDASHGLPGSCRLSKSGHHHGGHHSGGHYGGQEPFGLLN